MMGLVLLALLALTRGAIAMAGVGAAGTAPVFPYILPVAAGAMLVRLLVSAEAAGIFALLGGRVLRADVRPQSRPGAISSGNRHRGGLWTSGRAVAQHRAARRADGGRRRCGRSAGTAPVQRPVGARRPGHDDARRRGWRGSVRIRHRGAAAGRRVAVCLHDRHHAARAGESEPSRCCGS